MAKQVYKKDADGNLSNIGILISQTEFNNKQNIGAAQISNGSNLDDYKNEGRYYAIYGSNYQSVPINVYDFGLLVLKTASSEISQILISSNLLYIRTFDGTSWTDWKQLAYQEEMIEYSTINL